MTDQKRRRFHPAPAGRVMATGVSLSATLGIMAVLAANQPVWSTSSVAAGAGQTGTTPTTVVTDVVPRTIVLQPGQAPPAAGTPTDPAAAPAADAGGGGGQAAVTYTADSGGGGAAPAPVDTGGGAAPAPAPAPAPGPVVTSPPVTAPPVTAPPPPACTGSKC
jgi:hypothetical protein